MRLTTMAQALWFLRWLIKTGAENERVLRLVLPILKALPGLLREDSRWAASLRQLLPRPPEAGDEDSADGGDAPR
ncbi:hypothetical protein [Amycolatopsis kentuckyensis]|uniref:hypothetical protein n=1 Tax=Amycolatopsis kentuckyensis TaxID=218823 RepID=UPI0035630315